MHYDVVVVGAGHAGCEAAAAAARMGARVALVTMARANIGQMSCNPAIGGLGKGQLVREIDALDGLLGRAADAGGIQFRLLNRSRGPAVQGPRVQADRRRFAAVMRDMIDDQPGLSVVEAEVEDLIVAHGRVTGVVTSAATLSARAVVLATGTFLSGMLHTGGDSRAGGRAGERASDMLARRLRDLLPMRRLKTGTPPRLDGRTIDWAGLALQHGDAMPVLMSALTTQPVLPQVACGITRTTPATHALVRAHLAASPVHAGLIHGRGPRYCPSLEDKIVRFGDRDGHQVFLEPESLDDPAIYPNGISTALPEAVQRALVQTLPGCERARITRPGYAIEYDHVDPLALGPDLQVVALPGLWLAGQINGTTGYEEAAAQGLLAGVNAARTAGGGGAFVLDRATAYMGVLADDLVTQGVDEPYRMFTSRAEYRLRLRADNAGERLTGLGIALGVVGTRRAAHHRTRAGQIASLTALLRQHRFSPDQLAAAGAHVAHDGVQRSAWEWLRFAQVGHDTLARLIPALHAADAALFETVVTDARYELYVERQDDQLAQLRADEQLKLPADIVFAAVPGLSTEMAERLARARPVTVGQAGRVPGVTPAALAALLPHACRAA